MSPSDPIQTERARAVKDANLQWLLHHANVVGVGVGYGKQAGRTTDKVAIIVMVKKKLPAALLEPGDVLPTELDGVPLDIQEVGEIGAW